MDKSLTRTRIEIFGLMALYMLLLPRISMEYDMGFWRDWAVAINRYGVGHAYEHSINYMPVYLYGLWLYDFIQGSEAHIVANIHYIKLLFIFFDFLPLIMLCAFRQRILSFRIPHLFLLLNIAYIFNSMFWGQIDSMYTNLCFLAILVGISSPVAGSVIYLLALNTKPQAIEFLPIMALVLFYSIRKFSTLLQIILCGTVGQMFLLVPFINAGTTDKLIVIVAHTVGLYTKVSICAFNFWYLIQRSNPYFLVDTDTFRLFGAIPLGSYRSVGLALFGASTLAILWPMARHLYHLRSQYLVFDAKAWRLLFLGTGMLALCFFYFNTQMHERYANPIILFFFFYGAASRNYKLYLLASIPYFLSLDKCFPDFLPIPHYKIIYASVILALWYTATLGYGSWLYWREVKREE